MPSWPGLSRPSHLREHNCPYARGHRDKLGDDNSIASHNFDAARLMLAVSCRLTAVSGDFMPPRHAFRAAVLAALPVLLLAGQAMAQDRGGGFLANLFSRGAQSQHQPRGGA